MGGNPWHFQPNSVNIEMTAYALLCLTEQREISKAVPVVNWLFSQQNANGGFASTSDTYTALRALTEFGKGFEVQNRNTDMSIQYEFLGTVRRIKVSSESATTMQKRILPEETREVKIRATGNGISVIEVGYQYNLNVTSAWPSFVVNPQVTKVSDSNHMQVTVCTHFIHKTNASGSNMAVMEVNLPSGFTANQDTLPALRRYKGVKRVDAEQKDTKVVITLTRSHAWRSAQQLRRSAHTGLPTRSQHLSWSTTTTTSPVVPCPSTTLSLPPSATSAKMTTVLTMGVPIDPNSPTLGAMHSGRHTMMWTLVQPQLLSPQSSLLG